MIHSIPKVRQFGALPFYSMFSFESRFKDFKKLVSGTRHHMKQIVEKLFMLKQCRTFIHLCPDDHKDSILKALHMEDPYFNKEEQCGVWFTKYKVKKGHNYIFASKNPKISKHLSCVYKIGDSSYGTILEFVKDGNVISAIINLFDTNVDFNLYDIEKVKSHASFSVEQTLSKHMKNIFIPVKSTNTTTQLNIYHIGIPCVIINNVCDDISIISPYDCLSECH